jgi:hypothetical protein
MIVTPFRPSVTSSPHGARLTRSYVDFTHDTQFALLLPTMNLTSFASGGQLPWDGPPKHHSFIASHIMPFATNMQLQVLTCGPAAGADEEESGADKRWWGIGEEDDEEPEVVGAGEEKEQSKGKGSPAKQGKYVRIVLNDAVVPLTGINGCEEDEQGRCELGAFVDSMRELVGEVDFARECGKREG